MKAYRRAFFALFLFVSLAIIHLIINARIISDGYEIVELKSKLNKIRTENRSLSLIAAQKEDLAKIDNYAKKNGMFFPEKVQFITNESTSSR